MCVWEWSITLCVPVVFFFLCLFFFATTEVFSRSTPSPPLFSKAKRKSVSRSRDRHETMLSETKQETFEREGDRERRIFFFKCSLPLAICLFSYIHLNKRQLLLILVSYPPLLQPRNFSSSFFFLNSHSLPSLLVTQSSYEAGIIPSRK